MKHSAKPGCSRYGKLTPAPEGGRQTTLMSRRPLPPCFLGPVLALAMGAQAQPWQPRSAPGEGPNPAHEPVPVEISPLELEGIRDELRDAAQVIARMKADPDVASLLRRARGLFILTDYGRAALGLGMQGGKGLLMTRLGTDWGNPAFYAMSGLNIGPQVGASGGQVAYLLMTERAVQRFTSDRTFSLTAGAGLTFADAQARGLAATGQLNDVVIWSNAPGLFAGLSVGVMGITPDEEANRTYYGRDPALPSLILAGRIPNPHHNFLAKILAI